MSYIIFIMAAIIYFGSIHLDKIVKTLELNIKKEHMNKIADIGTLMACAVIFIAFLCDPFTVSGMYMLIKTITDNDLLQRS